MPVGPIPKERGNPISAFLVLQELIKGPEEGEVEEISEFDKYQFLSDTLDLYLRAPPFSDYNPVENLPQVERIPTLFNIYSTPSI